MNDHRHATRERPRSPEQARREINETRGRLSATLDRIGEQLEHKKQELREKADLARPVREKVREQPLVMAGAAFAAGVVIGLLRGWRGRGDRGVVERTVYVDVPDAERDYEDGYRRSEHSLLRELRLVLMHQIGNAIVAAIAGVISAKLAQHESEKGEPRE